VGELTFEYSNLNTRTPGWLFRLVRRLLPGIGLVENEIKPYAAAWSERNLEALASADPLWVVLGDSMSQGIGASSFDRGWVPQAQRALGDRGVVYRVVNLSFSGARVGDVLDRQLPALAGLSAAPDLITVLIGSNDIISQAFREIPNSVATMTI
jgi:lysophospholipase L1-like esterase